MNSSRRIKAIACVGVVGFLANLFAAFRDYDDAISRAVVTLGALGMVLSITIPAILLVQRQERSMARNPQQEDWTIKGYYAIVITTIFSAAVAFQLSYRPFGGSPLAILGWNFSLMLAVIVLIECVYRWKARKR